MGVRRGSGAQTRTEIVVALAAAASLVAVALSMAAQPVRGAGGKTLDVLPSYDSGPIGTTFVLVAYVYDESGQPDTGHPAHVRFYFQPGSANDPTGPSSSADMDCSTGHQGQCSVSYVAASPGTDTICAVASGSRKACDGAAESDGQVSVVHRTITPDPDPTAPPSGDPTESSAPTQPAGPTAETSPTQGPTETPEPTATPAPTDTPSPTRTPAPTATPEPSATPEPTATAAPKATTAPTATPRPTGTPAPTATPAPTRPPAPPPVRTHRPAPTRSPEPTPTWSPEPMPTTTPEASLKPAPASSTSTPPTGMLPQSARQSPDRRSGAAQAVGGAGPAGAGGGDPGEWVLEAVEGTAAVVIQPTAAAEVATTFGFPLILMLLVILFLLVQGRLDHRDPKLTQAARSQLDLIASFAGEDEL